MRIPRAGSDGKFRLVAELGRGGMGEVYLAVVSGPAGFNKLQVVKRLRADLARDEESVTMFLDEARLAARLSHPNVVQTIEAGQDGGHYVIAMEYLEGQSLDQLVRRAQATSSGLPLAIHLRILCDALAGLHHAHELRDYDGSPLGLVHRDVTPQNIFVTYDGVAKLLDFGIAKAATSAHETRTGTFKGKCAYMPPEQIVGERVDRRADLFSMGAILWQVATGERLWKGENDMRIFTRVVNGDIPSPRSVNPNVPRTLEAIINRALSPNRQDRFADALEMQAAIEDYAQLTGLRATDREVGRYVAQLFHTERDAIKGAVAAQLREIASQSDSRQKASVPLLGRPTETTGAFASTSMETLAPSSHRRVTSHGTGEASTHESLKAVIADPIESTSPPASPKRARIFMLAFALVAGFGTYAVGRLQPAPSKPANAASTTAHVSAQSPPAAPTSTVAERVAIRLSAVPASAWIYLDDKPLKSNPIEDRLIRDGARHVVRAEAPGFKSKSQTVSFSGESVSVSIVLEPDPILIER